MTTRGLPRSLLGRRRNSQPWRLLDGWERRSPPKLARPAPAGRDEPSQPRHTVTDPVSRGIPSEPATEHPPVYLFTFDDVAMVFQRWGAPCCFVCSLDARCPRLRPLHLRRPATRSSTSPFPSDSRGRNLWPASATPGLLGRGICSNVQLGWDGRGATRGLTVCVPRRPRGRPETASDAAH